MSYFPANDKTATISIAALNGTQAIAMSGRAGCSFEITAMGHAANVLTAQVTSDGTNWVNVILLNVATNVTIATVTATGTYTCDLAPGIAQVRVKMTSYTSGTMTGVLTATASAGNDVDVRSFVNAYSVLNSSVAQLTAGSTFTGTWEADLTWQGVGLGVFADQNLVVVFEQSSDGVTAHNQDTSQYTANSTGVDSFRLFNLISNYHRVKVTNVSSNSTTTFFINTYLTPNWSPIAGRALDLYGNQRVSLGQDRHGYSPLSSPTDELRVVEPIKLVGSAFNGNTVDPNFVSTSVATGTVTQVGTELILTSGTANGHYAKAYTTQRARFIGGFDNKMRMHVRLGDAGTTNNARIWGVTWGATMPTYTDGAYFKLSGTTFTINTIRGGSVTAVANGAFNGYALSYTPTTNDTVYEIVIANGFATFIIDGQIIHKVTGSTSTWTNTVALHAYADSINTGNSAAVTLNIRSMNIVRLGKEHSTPIYYNITGNAATHTLKLGAGVLHRIMFNNTSGTNITLYDQTTAAAPVVGVITTASGVLGAWDYDMPFFNGLVLVTTGNGLDATVIYE